MFHLRTSLLLFSTLSLSLQAWNIGQEVQTTSGTLIGHASAWQPEVSEYLGIPFAAAPIGKLRWEYPHPIRITGKIHATSFGPDCPVNLEKVVGVLPKDEDTEAVLLPLLQVGHPISEDCLTLNVWTKPQVGDRAKAVLIWFYGGGFQIGSTSVPTYNGARLANENDVIIVSANHRLNIFGFPNAPGIEHANLGLLDQRLAVEWVRDNIAAFGGDPNRITLVGQSSGGSSVDLYTLVWESDPIIKGIIAQSGTSAVGAGIGTMAQEGAHGSWYTASQNLGCGGQEAGVKTLDCMRKKSWKSIIAETNADFQSASAGVFRPVIDGKVVHADNEVRLKAGRFAKVPILVGTNDNEGGLVMVFTTALSKGFFGTLATQFMKTLPPIMNVGLVCAARDAAEYRAKKGVKAWRYRYFAQWPNLKVASGAGAYHGSEIPMVFGTSEYSTRRGDTPEQAKLSKLMRYAWTEFAKDPQNGLSRFGWPVYGSKPASLARIGMYNSSSITFGTNEEYDGVCNQVKGVPSLMQGISDNLANWFGYQSSSKDDFMIYTKKDRGQV